MFRTKTILRLIRFFLLGAVAAVIVSGTFGLDQHLPTVTVALLGGSGAAVAAKFGLLI